MRHGIASLYRAAILGALCILLAAPAAFAQRAAAPQRPGAALVPVEASTPAPSLETPSAPPTAPATAGLPPAAAPAAAGDERWDDRFGAPGLPDEVTALELAPDATLYAGVGRFTSHVARWNGRGWQNLAGDLNGQVRDMAIGGGTLYAVGDFTQAGAVTAKQIARWTGSAWAIVGSGIGPQKVDQYGTSEGDLYAIAAVGGDIYVGGDFNQIDGVAANGIARWDGAKWNALGQGVQNENSFDPQFVSGEVYTIVSDSGKLYVGGRFELAGGAAASSIAVWSTAASAWGALGAGMIDDDAYEPAGQVRAIAISGGAVYAGGNFDRAGGQLAKNIARWNGSAWSPLGAGLSMQYEDPLDQPVRAIAIVGANVYAGGELESAGGQVAKNLARWNGSAWSPIAGFDGYDSLAALAAAPGGGVYVGGDFVQAGGRLANHIAIWSGAEWRALGLGLTEFDTSSSPGTPRAIAVDAAGHVFVGGTFQTAGGVPVNNIAMWDGTRWGALGAGTEGDGGLDDGSVEALAIVGGDLYVGGRFTKAGGASARHLAKWNLATRQWSEVGGGVDGQVYALTASAGLLYVGGNFNTVGGVSAKDIATWNGAAWQALGSTVQIFQVFDNCSEQSTHVYNIAVEGSLVYVGGDFRLVYKGSGSICSVSSYLLANHLLVFDRAAGQWFTLGSGLPGVTGGSQYFAQPVSALYATGDNLYIGGHFGNAGTITAANLARFNLSSGWSAMSGGVSGTRNTGASGTGPEVKAFARYGPYLYVAGDFTATGGGPAESIARYDIFAGTWAALGSGLAYENSGPTIHALALSANSLYVGGKFSAAGGKPSSGIAAVSLGALPSQDKHVYLPAIKR